VAILRSRMLGRGFHNQGLQEERAAATPTTHTVFTVPAAHRSIVRDIRLQTDVPDATTKTGLFVRAPSGVPSTYIWFGLLPEPGFVQVQLDVVMEPGDSLIVDKRHWSLSWYVSGAQLPINSLTNP
jgi:hypothetical protein